LLLSGIGLVSEVASPIAKALKPRDFAGVPDYRTGSWQVTADPDVRAIHLRRGRKVGAIAVIGIILLLGWLGFEYASDRRQTQQLDDALEKLLGLLTLGEQLKAEERFDAVRQFIHTNSHHGDDSEFRELLGKKDRIAEEMIAYASGQRSEPIHLLCGARSNLMSAVLEKLGYETRIIALFDTDDEELRSHTFLEVRNPETGRWETQDPDFDLYWASKESGLRLSLAEAAEDLSKVEPCHRADLCGWTADDDEGKSAAAIRDLLDIICVTDERHGERFCRFTTRAKSNRIFRRDGDTGLFCDLMPTRCAQGFEPLPVE
jgi:hypothetical protein